MAQVCDIVLTSRPVGKDQRVPLAGVPYHSVEGYIAKLIQAGHKVAIVEQVGDVPDRGWWTARWRGWSPLAPWSNRRCWRNAQ